MNGIDPGEKKINIWVGSATVRILLRHRIDQNLWEYLLKRGTVELGVNKGRKEQN